MLRRIVAALVVLGLLAHAQLFAAHQAMALAASPGGDGGPSWLCLSDDGTVSPQSLKALAELKRALGQPSSPSEDPPSQASPCPVCFGLAIAFVLPAILQLAEPASFTAPPPAPPVFRTLHRLARFFLPPGSGPPPRSV